ncbi:Metallophosphoesterase 1 [Larimichthys crocea]|uniref:Uncharacterized protein n=1 Tax=Larimichthys crocea TaxID=215358 RepID=A0ACD3QQW0_LARCR|nr:Metallophosphoesterase 1 [Larimichthys crocea]
MHGAKRASTAGRWTQRSAPMVLSDTHLLGAVGGHWFDKLRREWQMERAFQTALWLLRPEIVFILGDIFDEGKWSSQKHWEDDVRRFHRMFRHSTDTELVVLVGNHDIGFHYEMDWFKLQRFEKVFNASSTRIVTKKGVNFLLVNSVALHGDGCPICQSVEKELIKLSRDLNCSLQSSQSGGGLTDSCEGSQLYPPTSPIMLQHYPLYRVSDAGCTGLDAAPPEERHLLFREKYDVLSKEASQRLLQWFKPRLILSGHTHSGCEVLHDNKYPEVSVPSFSWRNRNNPSFILASVSPGSYALSKVFPAGGEHGDRRVLLGRRLPAAADPRSLYVDERPAAVPQPLPAGEAQVSVNYITQGAYYIRHKEQSHELVNT